MKKKDRWKYMLMKQGYFYYKDPQTKTEDRGRLFNGKERIG